MSTQFPRLFQKIRRQMRRQPERYPTQYSAQPVTGNLAIISIPPGARIYIDDIDKGVNSSAIIADIDIATTHTLKLVLDGYQDYTDGSVSVTEGVTDTYFALLTPLFPPTGTGNLNVTSVPDGVTFYAITMASPETTVEGITPTNATFTDLPAGLYAYEAGIEQPPDYAYVMGTFSIVAGQTTNLNIPVSLLTPTSTYVLMESIPLGADIYIDGEPIGTKTAFVASISADTHTYELRLSGYQTKAGSFVGTLDVPTIVSEVLQPTSSEAGIILAAGIVAVGAVGLWMISKS